MFHSLEQWIFHVLEFHCLDHSTEEMQAKFSGEVLFLLWGIILCGEELVIEILLGSSVHIDNHRLPLITQCLYSASIRLRSSKFVVVITLFHWAKSIPRGMSVSNF